MDIRVRYSTKSRKFKTLAGAQRFAQKLVGETPDIVGRPTRPSEYYAVSYDGAVKVTCDECRLVDLFPKLKEEEELLLAEARE